MTVAKDVLAFDQGAFQEVIKLADAATAAAATTVPRAERPGLQHRAAVGQRASLARPPRMPLERESTRNVSLGVAQHI